MGSEEEPEEGCDVANSHIGLREQLSKKNEPAPLAVLIAAHRSQLPSLVTAKKSCRTVGQGVMYLVSDLNKGGRELDYKSHVALSQRFHESSTDIKARWTGK